MNATLDIQTSRILQSRILDGTQSPMDFDESNEPHTLVCGNIQGLFDNTGKENETEQ